MIVCFRVAPFQWLLWFGVLLFMEFGAVWVALLPAEGFEAASAVGLGSGVVAP